MEEIIQWIELKKLNEFKRLVLNGMSLSIVKYPFSFYSLISLVSLNLSVSVSHPHLILTDTVSINRMKDFIFFSTQQRMDLMIF